jgi:hypothetical protein
MNQKINFVTVCTESYTSEYAIKSLSMFSRNYSRAFNSFCITDKKEELQRDYETIDKNKELSGWWNKLSIFGLDLPGEFTVYVDLDLLILNDITHIIDFAVKNLAKSRWQISCFGDHIGWHGEKFGSALMIYKQDTLKFLFNEFMENIQDNILTVGGDQLWIGKRLTDILYLEHKFPNLVKSLKYEIGTENKSTNTWNFPNKIPDDFSLLNCHGEPKPHQLLAAGWPPIKEIWK